MSTFVFGHKNPDTDSVCSSIAYSHFKSQIGEIVEPRVLGDIRKEASFVLDYFDVKPPKFLSDVKVQAKDLNFDRILPLTRYSSVYEAFKIMEKENIHTLPIVDDDKKLIGIVSMKDIASALIYINDNIVDTFLKSLIHVFSDFRPRMIHTNSYDLKINGNLKVFNPNIPSDSVIDENDVIILKSYYKDEFFSKIKSPVQLIILPQYYELGENDMEIIKKYEIPVMSIELIAPMIIKKIHQTDSIQSIMKSEKINYFTLNDYLDDIKDSMLRTNFRNYPLVDENEYYVGLIGRRHLLRPGRKRVIMVDHNEFAQSATGIEEANILEIVDHHKIGGMSTAEPIQFMNIPVGSTCTIVYMQFKNNNIEIPYKIAGCLISGILSDTLYFKSPTCTKTDIEAVNDLNRILKLDLDDYTDKLFRAGSSIEGMTTQEVIYNDFKEFNIKGKRVAISQLFTMDMDSIDKIKGDVLRYMDDLADQKGYHIVLFAVTNILKEGSYIFFHADDKSIIDRAFNKKTDEGCFVEYIVSRKKQIVPMLTSSIESIA